MMKELVHRNDRAHRIAVDIRKVAYCELITNRHGMHDDAVRAVVKFGIPCGRSGFYERELEYETLEEAEAMFAMLCAAGEET